VFVLAACRTFLLTEGNEDNKGFQLLGDQDSVSLVIAYLESSSLSPSILLPALISQEAAISVP
jgi:hypothetical protein